MYNEPPALYDKNTVELMIEEQQEEIRRLAEALERKDDELERLRQEIIRLNGNIEK